MLKCMVFKQNSPRLLSATLFPVLLSSRRIFLHLWLLCLLLPITLPPRSDVLIPAVCALVSQYLSGVNSPHLLKSGSALEHKRLQERAFSTLCTCSSLLDPTILLPRGWGKVLRLPSISEDWASQGLKGCTPDLLRMQTGLLCLHLFLPEIICIILYKILYIYTTWVFHISTVHCSLLNLSSFITAYFEWLFLNHLTSVEIIALVYNVLMWMCFMVICCLFFI